MKKKNGVTLIALVVTITVLLILASVVTFTGMQVINSSKFTSFCTELKIMQTQVNSLYEDYIDGESIIVSGENYTGDKILDLQSSNSSEIISQRNMIFDELSKMNDTGVYIEDKEQYKYWDKNLIEELGIEGINRSFFVNVKKRSIIACPGYEYEGKKYYTINQIPDGLYNVEYENANVQVDKPTFEVVSDYIGEKTWKVSVKKDSIKYNGYIDKWQVKYKLIKEKTTYEGTSDNLSFIVNESGTYEITILNGMVKSDKKELKILNDEFYFDVETPSDTVTFERTADTGDNEDILTTEKTMNLIVKNNDGTNYNENTTTYTVSIENSQKFTFEEGDTITKQIDGTSIKNENIPLNIKIQDLTKPDKTFKLKIIATGPYEKTKTIEKEIKVKQEGAIQTIEDLVDLSVDIRNAEKSESARSERYKMTRNLDFEDVNSYENAHRTDYGNVNLDEYTDADLIAELTTKEEGHAGFLPIGLHETSQEFIGTFNGGGYTLSNLYLHKSKQINIGLFGYTINANISNFTIANGSVYNENQTAAMLIGKAIGGIVSNVTVEGGSVTSVDSINTEEDTYAGGIVGLMESNGLIENCTNKATVTTQFTGNTKSYSGPAGGIVGRMTDCTINNCNNYGTVTGQKFIGGIAGFAAIGGKGTVTNCHNYGQVKTYTTSTATSGPGQSVGGICGYNGGDGIVDSCVNHEEASISGLSNIGGIVGRNLGTITNCTNYAKNITGGSNVGGIFGQNTGTANSGNVDYFK